MPRKELHGAKKLSKDVGAAASAINTTATHGRKNVGPQRKARKKWVAKQKKKGRVQLSTWVPEDKRDQIKEFIDQLKDGNAPSAAFAIAFPGSLKAVVKIQKGKTATD